jgi:hypothetical protein
MYILLNEKKETSEHYQKFRETFFERYLNRLIENNKEEILLTSLNDVFSVIINGFVLA